MLLSRRAPSCAVLGSTLACHHTRDVLLMYCCTASDAGHTAVACKCLSPTRGRAHSPPPRPCHLQSQPRRQCTMMATLPSLGCFGVPSGSARPHAGAAAPCCCSSLHASQHRRMEPSTIRAGRTVGTSAASARRWQAPRTWTCGTACSAAPGDGPSPAPPSPSSDSDLVFVGKLLVVSFAGEEPERGPPGRTGRGGGLGGGVALPRGEGAGATQLHVTSGHTGVGTPAGR